MSETKKEYAGVTAYLRARFRTLESGDEAAHAPMVAISQSSQAVREDFLASSHLPEAVTRFLYQLDLKMDTLLAGMLSTSLEHDFPYGMEISAISASELAFTTDLPLAPGDWLEVVLNLGQQGLYSAYGIGTVTSRRADKDGKPFFSFTFTRLEEGEREKIIRFVFSEERKQLRETRLD